MLWEALQYAVTPAPLWARRNGFLRESIAIGARYGRVGPHWAPHLEASRQTVAHAADIAEGGRDAVVLGSGHGFDLPLDALTRRFDRVILVDAVHPLVMRWRTRGRNDIRLVTADVTGLHAPEPDLPETVDLVVSLNLISQLGVASGDGKDQRLALRAAHLRRLRECAATVCVIGDLSQTVTDASGGAAQTVSYDWPVPEDFPPPAYERHWDWAIAPRGEIARDLSTQRRVRAAIWRWR